MAACPICKRQLCWFQPLVELEDGSRRHLRCYHMQVEDAALEIERLRGLVRAAYKEGFTEGTKGFEGGYQRGKDWWHSDARKELEQNRK